ncbi:MAG: MFS transporter [Pyrinomonadaceae bacterium]
MSTPKIFRASTPSPRPRSDVSAFAALRHRDFRLLWAGQTVSVVGSQMQLVALNWHVYLLTKSALALGMVGLARVLPIILCSLAGGVVADAFDRKRLIVLTQIVMLCSALGLAVLTWAGLPDVWPLYALAALSSAAVAFENPARQALLPELVPARDFPNAVSLGLVAFQVAQVTGPLLAGLALANAGPALVYALNAVSFLAVILAVLNLRASGRAAEEEDGTKRNAISFESLREGWRFVWRTPIIVQSMTLDFVATFFASATALLPIFAAEVLQVGARGLGVLAAAPAAGAVVAGIVMARRADWSRPGALVLWSVAVYGAATLAFGLSRAFWLSCLMLAVSGAADTVSTVIRQTIRQLSTPNRLRGRMTSVNMIFFMGGPQLGELEAGLLAAAVGAPLSVVAGGVGCLVAAALAWAKFKELLCYRIESRLEDAG